jgi:hypothetical protein
MTFLKNHASEIVALDFFSVPTMNFRILYVLVFLSIGRRKIIFFTVTEHPSSEWSIQQLRNAFYDEPTPATLALVTMYVAAILRGGAGGFHFGTEGVGHLSVLRVDASTAGLSPALYPGLPMAG